MDKNANITTIELPALMRHPLLVVLFKKIWDKRLFHKQISLLFLVIFGFISCVKKELEDVFEEKVPVLNTLLISGEIVEVYLHESASKTKPRNFQFIDISNAEVEIYEDGNFIEILPWDDQKKCYIGTHFIQEGKSYEIRATLKDDIVLHGETIIPEAAVLNIIDEWDSIDPSNRKALIRHCEATFGPSTTKRFFPHVFSEVWTCARTVQSNCYKALHTNYTIYNEAFQINIISREYFVLSLDYDDLENSSFQFKNLIISQASGHSIDSMITIVDVMSEPLYKYVMQLDDLNSSNFYDPFIEPPTTYSNVKNGTGIVGGIGRAKWGAIVEF
ncbi:MAG: DUF4249 family protein [Cryomorphaceae bacterium]|nr:DUF4249 family protein [Cryomorphaceae bacterium]